MSVSRICLLSIALAWLQTSAQPPGPSAASAQITPANPTLDQLVDELVENAARDRAMLPSLTARESIVSKVDEFAFHGKTQVKAEAKADKKAKRKAKAGKVSGPKANDSSSEPEAPES